MREARGENDMPDEAKPSDLFLTFLSWARAASEQNPRHSLPVTGVTIGMSASRRHVSCYRLGAAEADHEATIQEL
jgi:hypothetical protein